MISANIVYLVQHVSDEDGPHEIVHTVGVYSSPAAAEAAILRARGLPGFTNWPDGFYVDRYVLDKDQWVEGFGSAEPWEHSSVRGKL